MIQRDEFPKQKTEHSRAPKGREAAIELVALAYNEGRGLMRSAADPDISEGVSRHRLDKSTEIFKSTQLANRALDAAFGEKLAQSIYDRAEELWEAQTGVRDTFGYPAMETVHTKTMSTTTTMPPVTTRP
jgi:hypothetical protein